MTNRPGWLWLTGVVAALFVWTAPAVGADVGRVIRSARTPLISEAFAVVKGHAAEPFARMRAAGQRTADVRAHSSIRAAFAAHRHQLNSVFPRADAR
jgi:hypothetical protein